MHCRGRGSTGGGDSSPLSPQPLARSQGALASQGVSRQDDWAVVLAGGHGMRLQSFIRQVLGSERPKQFCRIIGTWLDRSWRSPRNGAGARTLCRAAVLGKTGSADGCPPLRLRVPLEHPGLGRTAGCLFPAGRCMRPGGSHAAPQHRRMPGLPRWRRSPSGGLRPHPHHEPLPIPPGPTT